MAVLAAMNLEDRLVLLEDGRELPITQFYGSGDHRHPLRATDELRGEHRLDSHHGADVFTVDIPGAGAALIFELSAISEARARDIN